MKRLLLLTLGIVLCAFVQAQSTTELWADVPEAALLKNTNPVITANKYRSLTLNQDLMEALLATAPIENTVAAKSNPLILELPLPNGKMQQFEVVESPIMAPGLKDRYTNIRTYAGRGVQNKSAYLRLDLTPKGFHAMIMAGAHTWYIDPYGLTNTGQYISYFKKDFQTDQSFECHVESEQLAVDEEVKNLGPNPVGEQLRTYRLAIAATGDYTQFHGGTVADGMAALVTLMNRVNGVYERDISVRMILVENNDTVVFTNPNTDPYPNGPALGTNQEVLDDYIGNANYDIGHVVGGGGGGGVAFLQSVCNTENKARGLTALGQPIGDPFAIDYVAHEMGHQFGGNHTFNGTQGSCGGNRAGSRAFEPGSGTSIMAYAGICGSDNTQPNSDDHFHVGSFDEMAIFTLNGGGNTCTVTIPTDNTPPIVDAGPSGYVIPMSTPFELTASASDMEGDSMTYCWEQFDLGPAGAPNNPSGNAPLFRTFSPTNDSTRVFPRISAIVNNSSSLGEYLPDYARNMQFRCTVRDNHGFGGGVDWDQMSMSVTDQAGPFRVTSQNFGGTWTSGAYEIVTWDVANTDQAPVNASNVNIYLSLDGGFTYPITLAQNLPNNGEAAVLVPEGLVEANCRVKVKGAGNVFFDINNQDFEIQAPTETGFSYAIIPSTQAVCGGEEAVYTLSFAGFLGFSEMIDISQISEIPGLNVLIDTTNFVPPVTVTVTISGTENVSSGTYDLELQAGSMTSTVNIPFSIEVFESAPGAITLASPMNEEINVPTFPTFEWVPLPEATTYTLEISDQADFSNILLSEAGLTEPLFTLQDQLVDSTQYFWRIRGANEVCGDGENSETFSFVTEVFRCETFVAEDLPKPYTNFPFVSSRLEIEEDLGIRDVNILNLEGTKAPGEELEFQLRGPDNITITLIPDNCGSGTSYDIELDDESPLGSNIPCPLNNGLPYRPAQALSAFDGLSAQGIWRLFVYNGNPPGELTNWALEICYGADAVSTQEIASWVNHFILFPNPASSRINVEIGLDRSEELHVQVLNGLGQVMKQENWGKVSEGIHRFDLDLSAYPDGMYFVRVLNEQRVLLRTGKLIKQ
jgi:hypothetical protein